MNIALYTKTCNLTAVPLPPLYMVKGHQMYVIDPSASADRSSVVNNRQFILREQ